MLEFRPSFVKMEKFKVEKKLGGGIQGIVYLAHLNEDPSKKFAIKSIPCLSWDDLQETAQEISILMGLRHRYIVDHLEYFLEQVRIFAAVAK